jgi:hypothetical protein
MKVVVVPEPSKFRIITEGDGFMYTALQPIQGAMLTRWKRSRFSTMLRDDLSEAIREMDARAPGWMFCSVDYEAATDLIKKDATILAIGGMRDWPGYDLLFKSLVSHCTLHYPKEWEGELPETAVGVDAQPMGHPNSFPLLCLINGAVLFTAERRWLLSLGLETEELRRDWINRGLGICDKIVLINGDDMLFKCPKDFYPFFVAAAADAGLKMSVGKQYLADDFALINSQYFVRRGGVMRRVGYLNMKLVEGTSLKGGDSLATPDQIGKELSKMIDLCPQAACAVPYAFSRWRKEWFKAGFVPNWYLPVHLGGFGMDIRHAPSGWKITRDQRRMARLFLKDVSLQLYRRLHEPSVLGPRFRQAVSSFSVVSGLVSTVPREHESYADFDDGSMNWLVKISLCARAMHEPPISDAALFRRIPLGGIKPLTMERIAAFWRVRFLSLSAPACPPLPPIRLDQLRFEAMFKRQTKELRAAAFRALDEIPFSTYL